MTNCDYSVPYGVAWAIPCSPYSGAIYYGYYTLFWRY